MYQALYRKYRPSTFDEVYGQDIIKKTIINEINNNKISHAYLFCGPRGTGKTSVAKLIAKLVNCKNSINGKTCEECESCISFNNKNYIDIIEIDAASNNGVDEIRELRSKANLLPAVSKYKIYIYIETLEDLTLFDDLLTIYSDVYIYVGMYDTIKSLGEELFTFDSGPYNCGC